MVDGGQGEVHRGGGQLALGLEVALVVADGVVKGVGVGQRIPPLTVVGCEPVEELSDPGAVGTPGVAGQGLLGQPRRVLLEPLPNPAQVLLDGPPPRSLLSELASAD